jgi:predicted porin
MKKTLIALAAVAATGAAFAQSTVTLFGIVDAGYASVKNSSTATAASTKKSGITNSGLNSSRLGFRGEEDLGGGMKAGFWLETALANDSDATAVNFARRSTVSLMGGFGEVRIGRDYTPTFWNTTVYDAFGTNGVGQASTPGLIHLVTPAINTTAVRSNNSVSYFMPAMSGFTGQVMVAFGENVQTSGTSSVKTGDYLGLRGGYATGPLSVHAAYGKLEGAANANDVKTTNFGASYDLGMIKPALFVGEEKTTTAKVGAVEVSVTAPVGAGTIRAAYSKYDVKNTNNDASKFALGYVYDLSKRTAVYGTYAAVTNKGTQTLSVANNGLTNAAANAGGKSSGFEAGLRHSF